MNLIKHRRVYAYPKIAPVVITPLESCFSQLNVVIYRHKPGFSIIAGSHLCIALFSILEVSCIKVSANIINSGKMLSSSIYALVLVVA